MGVLCFNLLNPNDNDCENIIITPQTNPDSQPRSEPALELQSRAASKVGDTSPFQWSQYRKQFLRKADHKKIKKL